jgi:drug/metabolite transporter (DMT)-like permease
MNLFTSLLLFSWFVAGTVGTLANKYTISIFRFPLLLTVCIIGFGTVVDYLIVKRRGVAAPKFCPKTMVMLLPIVFSVLFSKTLTFVAFGSIPVSLTLTVKSASPLFSVVLEKFVSGKTPGLYACLTLVPIAVGVTMSSISEVQFALHGLIAAASSTLMVVAQTMYTKRCMEKVKTLDPLLLHLYTSATAMVIVVPYLLYTATNYYLAHRDRMASPTLDRKMDTQALEMSNFLSTVQPLLIIILGVGCVYIQNMSSLAFLNATSTISHQVATTCNKFLVIMSTIFVFHEPVSVTNVCGFVVAGLGFLAYTLASSSDPAQCKLQDKLLPTDAQGEGGDVEMGAIS